MNKQEMQNKIDNVQSKIDELQNKQNKLKEEASKLEKEYNKLKIKLLLSDNIRWRAKGKSPYYMIGGHGYILEQMENFGSFDTWNYNAGNYFKTEQEAQNYKDNLITKQKLKDLALRLNNGAEIDWHNDYQKKYYIHYSFFKKELCLCYATVSKFIGEIYCLNDNFLNIAIQEIGEEALIKLIKSGV